MKTIKDNPTPEAEGEWRVDYDGDFRYEVFKGRKFMFGTVSEVDANRIATAMNRDHNRKFDPDDVEAFIKEWENKTPLMFGEAAKWSRRMDAIIAKLKGGA